MWLARQVRTSSAAVGLHPTYILLTSYLHPTYILPTSYLLLTYILLTSYLHPTVYTIGQDFLGGGWVEGLGALFAKVGGRIETQYSCTPYQERTG